VRCGKIGSRIGREKKRRDSQKGSGKQLGLKNILKQFRGNGAKKQMYPTPEHSITRGEKNDKEIIVLDKRCFGQNKVRGEMSQIHAEGKKDNDDRFRPFKIKKCPKHTKLVRKARSN